MPATDDSVTMREGERAIFRQTIRTDLADETHRLDAYGAFV